MTSDLLPFWGAMGDAFLCKRNLLSWHESFVGKKREKAWRAALLCLMWTIWKERNRRAFDDIERNDQDIVERERERRKTLILIYLFTYN